MSEEGYIQIKHREIREETDSLFSEIEKLRSELNQAKKVISMAREFSETFEHLKDRKEKENQELIEAARNIAKERFSETESRFFSYLNKELQKLKDFVNKSIAQNTSDCGVMAILLGHKGIISKEEYEKFINSYYDKITQESLERPAISKLKIVINPEFGFEKVFYGDEVSYE